MMQSHRNVALHYVFYEEDLKMKQRRYIVLAMLTAAALTMTACSAGNTANENDGAGDSQQTEEAQESDAYLTEAEAGEGDGVYMYKPIAADAFTYDIAQTDLGDQTFTLKNNSDQSYSYVSADILFYNADDEIVDYYQGVSFNAVMAGGEQTMRINPALAPGDYDHLEVLFTGMKKDSTAAVDPSGLVIEKQAKLATNQVIAKCKNQTGQDLEMATFLISYYNGDQLLGTQTASFSDISDGQEFIVNAGYLYDGWYENELEYDSYTIEPISADALAQG